MADKSKRPVIVTAKPPQRAKSRRKSAALKVPPVIYAPKGRARSLVEAEPPRDPNENAEAAARLWRELVKQAGSKRREGR